MRVLQLTPRPSFPLHDGGRIAMFEAARGMRLAGADVAVLTLEPRKHRASGLPADIRTVDIDTSRVIGPAWRSLISGVPYVIARFVSRDFMVVVTDVVTEFRPDVVQIESPFLLPYLPHLRRVTGALIALRTQNIEHRIWEQLAANETRPLRRLALRRVAASLRRYEIAQQNSCDVVVPISNDDAADHRALGCVRPIHVLRGGLDLSRYAAGGEGEPGTVAFLGSLDYRPNQEAVQWLLDEVAPLVPRARLRIGGSRPPHWLREHAAARGVELHADVPDAHAFLRDAAVIAAPLLSGSGVRVKILEAMALQRPVVATSAAAQGLDVVPGRDLLIGDHPRAFAAALERCLADPPFARAMAAEGRAFIAREHDSIALGRDLLAFYRSRLG